MHRSMFMTRVAAVAAVAAAVVAAALMLCGLGAATAHADEEGAGAISVTYNYGGKPVEGAYFHLYKVADWNEAEPDVPLSDTLTDAFRAPVYADINWKLLDSKYERVDADGNEVYAEDWYLLASTLFQTMKLDGFAIEPVAGPAETDANGVARFTGLSDGVYFLVSPLESVPKAVYSAQLVSVPEGTAAEHAGRQVDVTAKGTPWSGKDPIHVKKIWNDGDAADRPASIKVTLYYQYDEAGPFEEYETVELNAANNWSYEWTRLPESMDYVVHETEVPAGYTMTMQVDRVSATTSYWTITNSKPANPPTTPVSVETPTTPPTAYTGSDVLTIATIAVAALAIGVLLIVLARRNTM